MTRTVPDVGKSSLCLRPCVILCHSVCPDRTPALTAPPPLSPRGRVPPQLPHSRSASPFLFPLTSFPLDHSLLSHIFLRPYPITISCFISLSYFSHSLSRFLPFLFLPFSFPFPPFLISSLLFPRFFSFPVSSLSSFSHSLSHFLHSLSLPVSFPFPLFLPRHNRQRKGRKEGGGRGRGRKGDGGGGSGRGGGWKGGLGVPST